MRRPHGGGLLGLPSELSSSRGIVIPVDDAAAVTAVRSWTQDSTQTLVAKLVPALQKQIK